jgi:hypothetical protein
MYAMAKLISRAAPKQATPSDTVKRRNPQNPKSGVRSVGAFCEI